MLDRRCRLGDVPTQDAMQPQVQADAKRNKAQRRKRYQRRELHIPAARAAGAPN